jgi:plasmid stabilization system protein ParE
VPRLIWSAPALNDVQRLYRFLVEKNSDAAKRTIGTILDGIGILARHPGIGRPVEGMEPEYRDWLIDFVG